MTSEQIAAMRLKYERSNFYGPDFTAWSEQDVIALLDHIATLQKSMDSMTESRNQWRDEVIPAQPRRIMIWIAIIVIAVTVLLVRSEG